MGTRVMRLAKVVLVVAMAVVVLLVLGFLLQTGVLACSATRVTPDTPTGIAGCYREGVGTASHYGPGNGAAMNYCTWTLRHSQGCGTVRITALDTGRTVHVPVVDFCDCYTGTPDERIVDLQYGVVTQLGLDLGQGLYPVRVQLGASHGTHAGATLLLPDTAAIPPGSPSGASTKGATR